MATLTFAVLFFCLGLGSLRVSSASSRSFPINANLRAAPQPEEVLLNLREGTPSCADPLACPENPQNTVTFPYSNGRSGRLTATYNEDGSLHLATEGSVGSSSSAVLTKTSLAVGDSSTEEPCRVDATVTRVQFDQCGFQQVFREDVIYREVVVRVRHRFAPAGGSSPVHFFGGINVRVRVYLHLATQDTLLTTVPVAGHEEIGTCSALNHELVAEVAITPNRHQFTVRAKDYIPLDVGFKVESCVLRPYLLDASVSFDPAHEIKLIQGGLYVGPNPSDVQSQGVQGIEYTLTIPRLKPRLNPSTPIDRFKSSQVSCEVCLCKIAGPSHGAGRDSLPQCPNQVTRSFLIRQELNLSPLWEVIPDGEPDDAGLEAGSVDVVSASHWFL